MKRYKATCPVCGRTVERAKREAAEWVMAQHVTYEHGVVRDPESWQAVAREGRRHA